MKTPKVIMDIENQSDDKAKRLRILLGVIAAAVFMGSGFFAFLNRKWLKQNPVKPWELSAVSDVATDEAGYTYVVMASSTTLIKITPDYKLEKLITADEAGVSGFAHIACGGDGRVYIHDSVIERGVRISYEQIVSLNSDFKDLKVIAEVDVPEGSARQSVIGMSPVKGGIRYFVKDASGIDVFDENGQLKNKLSLAKAYDTVLYAVMDPDTEDVYYVTFTGQVRKYVDEENDEILYDSDDVEGSIPQGCSIYNGILFVADIGLRDVVRIHLANENYDRVHTEGEDKLDRLICVRVSACGNLSLVSSYSLYAANGNGFTEYYELPLAAGLRNKIVFVWICAFACGFCFLIIISFFVYFLVKRASVYTRISLMIFAGVAGIAFLLVGTLFPEFKKQLMDQIYDKEIVAAAAVSDRIPADALLALNKPSAFMNEDYEAVKDAVNGVITADSDTMDALYCVAYRVIDGVVTLTYTMEDICVVYPYDWDYEGSEVQDVIENESVLTFNDSTASGSFVFVYYPITADDGTVIGMLEVGTDMQSVNEKNRKIMMTLLLNLLAMTVIAIMMTIELMHYVRGRNEYLSKRAVAPTGEKVHLTPGIFRFITFLIFFFTNLTSVIMPIFARRLAISHGVSAFSPETVAAVTVSAEVFAGAIFSALGGKIIEKLGAKRSILVSGILFTVGLALRIFPSIIMLVLGSMVLGAGWGVLLIMVNVQIAELPDEEKDRGYAYYSVSSVSGINCAVVLGGFLVQWVSYRTLFAITAVTSILLYFVCRKYLADNMPEQTEETSEAEEKTSLSLTGFLFKPRVISFFLLLLVPLLICGYFLNYMFPILGDDMGLSETYIGYALMLNGICALAFGTPLTEMFGRRNLRAFGLLVCAALYADAFLLVAFRHNILSLLLALLLIGLADSFGIPLFTAYFTELDEVEKFGYEKGFGVYSLFENAAQALGPLVLSCIYGIGIKNGMLVLSIALITLAVLFFMIAVIGKRRRLGVAGKEEV